MTPKNENPPAGAGGKFSLKALIASSVASVMVALGVAFATDRLDLNGTVVTTKTTTVRAAPITQIQEVGPSGRPCAGTSYVSDPPYEPNDLIAQASGPLRRSVRVNAALEHEGDVDVFALCVTRLGRVKVRLSTTGCEIFEKSDEWASSADCDVTLELIDEDGKKIASAETEYGQTVFTVERRVQPGKYYAQIADGNGFRYELQVLSDPPLTDTWSD
jgi:hypothetical protein